MSKRIINLSDSYKGLKESISVTSDRPKGEVGIFEKSKSGVLTPIGGRKNMIVFSGREWLLRRAFGSTIAGNDINLYGKVIKWFGIGNGGGEPGNPLQAGASYGQDTGLYQPVRLRSDLVEHVDPGFSLYASDYQGNHGYYKTFSSIVIREDRGNPYTEGNVTHYPPLIAEIRIELSSDDAVGGSYEDLNEAALFLADPLDNDPGKSYEATGQEIGSSNIIKVVKDGDYAIYYFDTYDLAGDLASLLSSSSAGSNSLNVGDYMWTSGFDNVNDPNEIVETAQSLVVDIFNGEDGVRKAYIVVEKPDAQDSPYSAPYPLGHFVNKTITPYIMFSRVTFSTIRKTTDREIVFLWKIYF